MRPKRLAEFTPQALINIAWAFATMRFYPEAVLDAFVVARSDLDVLNVIKPSKRRVSQTLDGLGMIVAWVPSSIARFGHAEVIKTMSIMEEQLKAILHLAALYPVS